MHLDMEVEQLRLACELMKKVEKRDPEEILPAPEFALPLIFRSNKEYVREVLATQIDLTTKDSLFVPVSTLGPDDRYRVYQRKVNGNWSPTEEVIRQNAAKNGQEYRLETEGPHPVPGLRLERNGSETDYARLAKAA
jgi:uncharacterized C2H2 Zn-finger protein